MIPVKLSSKTRDARSLSSPQTLQTLCSIRFAISTGKPELEAVLEF